ncbi:hypothetical protein GGF32_004281 [Allomyces javanicus]|nr:hypothetical protein GGF32_004281 [Allomyces javanicus]
MSKVIRFAFDAVLVSTVVAGIRRSSGITLATDKIDNEQVRYVAERYLEAGEWVMDKSVDLLAQSSLTNRKVS